MQIVKTAIPEVLIVEPKMFGDQRGFFLETFQAERWGVDDEAAARTRALRAETLMLDAWFRALGAWV